MQQMECDHIMRGGIYLWSQGGYIVHVSLFCDHTLNW